MNPLNLGSPDMTCKHAILRIVLLTGVLVQREAFCADSFSTAFANCTLYYAIPSTQCRAVLIADLNADNRKDVVLTTSFTLVVTNRWSAFVFLQSAAGNLQAPIRYPAGAEPTSIAVADFTADGNSDIAVGTPAGLRVFVQGSTGSFNTHQDIPTLNARLISAADFNSDGLTDIVGIGWDSHQMEVFTQTNGALALTSTHTVIYEGFNDFEAGDVNGDHLTDIVILSGQGAGSAVAVLLQTNNNFSQPIYCDMGRYRRGIGLGDLTGDKRNDIVMSTGLNEPNARIVLWQFESTGAVTKRHELVSHDIPAPVVATDLDFNGWDDIVTLHDGWARMGIYFQTSAGVIAPESLFACATTDDGHGLAVGDINGDDMPDVAIAAYGGLVISTNRLSPPLRITSIKRDADGQVTLTRYKDSSTCLVETAQSSTNWMSIGTMPGTTWTDTSASNYSRRFYRLKRP